VWTITAYFPKAVCHIFDGKTVVIDGFWQRVIETSSQIGSAWEKVEAT
jgi:hypothetical protein